MVVNLKRCRRLSNFSDLAGALFNGVFVIVSIGLLSVCSSKSDLLYKPMIKFAKAVSDCKVLLSLSEITPVQLNSVHEVNAKG